MILAAIAASSHTQTSTATTSREMSSNPSRFHKAREMVLVIPVPLGST